MLRTGFCPRSRNLWKMYSPNWGAWAGGDSMRRKMAINKKSKGSNLSPISSPNSSRGTKDWNTITSAKYSLKTSPARQTILGISNAEFTMPSMWWSLQDSIRRRAKCSRRRRAKRTARESTLWRLRWTTSSHWSRSDSRRKGYNWASCSRDSRSSPNFTGEIRNWRKAKELSATR